MRSDPEGPLSFCRSSSWFCAAVAATIVLGSSPAVRAQPQPEKVVITAEAEKLLRAGEALLDHPRGPRYEDAYKSFKQAYELSPAPEILGYLGLCAMKLERDGEAIAALSRYLSEVDNIPPPEREQLTKDLDALKAGVVAIELSVSPPGATVIDQRLPVQGDLVVNQYGPLAAEPLSIGVRPGHHKIIVTRLGYEDAVWELQASPDKPQKKSIELTTAKAQPKRPKAPPLRVTPATDMAPIMVRPVSTAVWISLAATGALAVGTVAAGVLALSNKGTYDDANDGTDPATAKAIRETGLTLNLTTDILLGATVAAGALTAILYLARPSVPLDGLTMVAVTPYAGVSSGGLTFTGAF